MKHVPYAGSLVLEPRCIGGGGVTCVEVGVGRVFVSLLPFDQAARIRSAQLPSDERDQVCSQKVYSNFTAKTQLLEFGIPDGRHGASRVLNH